MISINSSYNNSPSFSGSFVKKVPILKYSESAKMYFPYEADFVKLEQKCAEDVKLAEKICFNDKFRSFGEYLFAMWLNKKWNYPSVKSNSLYGVILPQEDNSNPIIDNVLGVTEFVENHDNQENKIMFMITNQDYQKEHRSDISKYKQIGKSMSDALKELYPQKPISVFAEWDAIGFWQKQGYRNITERKLIYNG
jgi:hypothetical protein